MKHMSKGVEDGVAPSEELNLAGGQSHLYEKVLSAQLYGS